MTMNKWLVLICIFLSVMLGSAYAVTFDDMLVHRSSSSQPFWGDYYKNIKWISHTIEPDMAVGDEADYRGQIF